MSAFVCPAVVAVDEPDRPRAVRRLLVMGAVAAALCYAVSHVFRERTWSCRSPDGRIVAHLTLPSRAASVGQYLGLVEASAVGSVQETRSGRLLARRAFVTAGDECYYVFVAVRWSHDSRRAAIMVAIDTGRLQPRAWCIEVTAGTVREYPPLVFDDAQPWGTPVAAFLEGRHQRPTGR